MQALTWQDRLDGSVGRLDVEGLFISIGLEAGAPLPGYPDTDEGGYILSRTEARTSIPGLFAAGDICSKPFRQVATAVGDGTVAAMAASDYLLRQARL
jgi:thioredoxin reductase (NADPH)